MLHWPYWGHDGAVVCSHLGMMAFDGVQAMGAAPVKQLSKTKSVNPHKTLSKQHLQVRSQTKTVVVACCQRYSLPSSQVPKMWFLALLSFVTWSSSTTMSICKDSKASALLQCMTS